MKQKNKGGVQARQQAAGWAFLTPATLLIFLMSFYPMVQAFITSLKTGSSANLQWAEPLFNNYTRMLQDRMFKTAMGNTFLYLIIQVPIMLVLAILLAQLLNNKNLKFRGLFRTMIFLPCATALVSYAIIFKTLFATQGLINSWLVGIGIVKENINWLGQPGTAKAVIIIALLWRWTGYNMVFFLAGLQNIDYSGRRQRLADLLDHHRAAFEARDRHDGHHVHQRHAPAVRRIRQPDQRRPREHHHHHVPLHLQQFPGAGRGQFRLCLGTGLCGVHTGCRAGLDQHEGG